MVFAKPLPWQGILASAYIGAFEMGITFVLWLKALKPYQHGKVGKLFISCAFCCSDFYKALILNEKIIWTTVAGLIPSYWSNFPAVFRQKTR